ncbi:MAG: hypothetical protein JXJ17_03470 [Anaerolineae bacterium]|nr:hypothetical protein [Anaerolineae bacterium]
MSRLSQMGVFCIVLGGVVFFLGMFPSAVDADSVPGIGITQILAMLAGLFLLILGGYVVAFAMFRRGRPATLISSIGVRLGLTGMVFATAATMADALGFGSHSAGRGLLFGWLQAGGMLIGFGIAALGVLVYGMSRS